MSDLRVYGTENPTEDEANLLQGLFEQIAEFDKDDIISAGEWLWSFLNDIAWRTGMQRLYPGERPPRVMQIVEATLQSSDYDMDIKQLREQGRKAYAKRIESPPDEPSHAHRKSTARDRARAVDAAFGERSDRVGDVERARPARRRRSR